MSLAPPRASLVSPRSTHRRSNHFFQPQKTRHATIIASSNDPQSLTNLPDPDDARSAIAIGLKLTEAQQWVRAQEYFELALDLPGTGLKRFRDKPRQLSDGERIAIMYNIACCQSRLGEQENIQNGLMAIAGCLEAGYDNFQQLRSDPDLENLRGNEKFEGLVKKFEGKGGFMGLFKSL